MLRTLALLVVLLVGCNAPAHASIPSAAEVELLQRAQGGDIAAQKTLALLYRGLLDTTTLARDESEAAKWLLAAARQGDATSQAAIGTRYLSGLGIAPHLGEALRWLRLAADARQADAYQALGDLYRVGQGVPQDPAATVALWNLARQDRPHAAPDALATLQKSLSADDAARTQRMVARVAQGEQVSAVLGSEVRGSIARYLPAMRRPHYFQSRTSQVALTEFKKLGAWEACVSRSNSAPDDIVALRVQDQAAASRPDSTPSNAANAADQVAVRCLSVALDLECALPSPRYPAWKGPQFTDPSDDHCDLWRRGPAPVAPSSMIGPTSPTATQQRQQRFAPWMRPEIPRRLALAVLNRSAFSAQGQVVAWPGAQLDSVLAGRPALVVHWRPDCSVCDSVLDALHRGFRSRPVTPTDHRDARLVIVFHLLPGEGVSQAEAYQNRLSERYPSRLVLGVIGRDTAVPIGMRLPVLRVLDRNGLLRATTSGHVVNPFSPAWGEAHRPFSWLDVALGDAVWRPTAQDEDLTRLIGHMQQGRLVLAPVSAPRRIVIPGALHQSMQTALETARTQGKAQSTFVIRNDQDLGLLAPSVTWEPATGQRVDDIDELERRWRALPIATANRVVGLLHVTTRAAPIAQTQLEWVAQTLMPIMFGLPDGRFMLAVPTHDHLASQAAINPELGGSRARLVQQERLHHQALQASANAASALPAPSLGMSLERYARLLGIALYLGSGPELTRIADDASR